LYELDNVTDIIRRIKDGLALIIPARNTIAIFLHKQNKKSGWGNFYLFGYYWKRPREGVEYSSFGDFAKGELNMGEEYRDYIAVGKVIYRYYYFLDGLTDMDTEDTFFKLRYLPKALNTHKGDEYLVLARLRSLTVREFKLFSEKPDFEIEFSKKLTKKKRDIFDYYLQDHRNKLIAQPENCMDYIEIFDDNERNVINEFLSNLYHEKGRANDAD
jgi:hypothetical protein